MMPGGIKTFLLCSLYSSALLGMLRGVERCCMALVQEFLHGDRGSLS